VAKDSSKPRYATRVALALGRTVVHEATVGASETLTIGHAASCTFVLPIEPVVGAVALVRGGELHLVAGLDGRVTLAGETTSLESLRAGGRERVVLAPEDWGVLWLRDRPDVRLVVMQVPREPLQPMPSDGALRPLLACTLLAALSFGSWITFAFLEYDPDRPKLELADVDERFTRAIFNDPPRDPVPPEEEEKPEISDEEKAADKARKRAAGEEGTYGRPDRTGRSNIPRTDSPTSSNATNIGLVKELNTLAQTDTMADLLSVGGEINGTDTGPLVVGAGTYGMSTRGSGGGGGGEGEGVIHGTAKVDMGGSGAENRKRTVKGAGGPKEREVSVQTGTPKVRGQLSKELIDKEVRRHRPQIGFCYNKELTRNPNLSGKVSLSWIISLDGSVKSAKVKSSSLGNSNAESCMVRALQNWRFPKPEGGVVEVEYPFVFDAK
jgi:TonB family protein